MNRIIRAGIPQDRLYSRKALSGIRYIYKHNHDIKIAKVKIEQDDYIFEALLNNKVDMVITEYDKLISSDELVKDRVVVGLVLPQGDTRDVLITLKKSHNRFDYAVVECHSDEAKAYVEHTYDGVSCKNAYEKDALQIDRILAKQCDAAVLSADRVRSLGIDKNRHLRYTFFKNRFDSINTKAVWVAVIRNDDKELSDILMPMSDIDTLKRLTR